MIRAVWNGAVVAALPRMLRGPVRVSRLVTPGTRLRWHRRLVRWPAPDRSRSTRRQFLRTQPGTG